MASSLLLLQGFGLEGLGIVTVSGVPDYPQLRQQLLPLAQAFAVRAGTHSCCCRLHPSILPAQLFLPLPHPTLIPHLLFHALLPTTT